MVASPRRASPAVSKLSVATPLGKRKFPPVNAKYSLSLAPEAPFISADSRKRRNSCIVGNVRTPWEDSVRKFATKSSRSKLSSSVQALSRSDLGFCGANYPWLNNPGPYSSLQLTREAAQSGHFVSTSDVGATWLQGYTALRPSQLGAVPRDLHAPIRMQPGKPEGDHALIDSMGDLPLTYRERAARTRIIAEEEKRAFKASSQQVAEVIQELVALPVRGKQAAGSQRTQLSTPLVVERAGQPDHERLQLALEKMTIESMWRTTKKRDQELGAKMAQVDKSLGEVDAVKSKIILEWEEEKRQREQEEKRYEEEKKLRDKEMKQHLERYTEQVVAHVYNQIRQEAASAGAPTIPAPLEPQEKIAELVRNKSIEEVPGIRKAAPPEPSKLDRSSGTLDLLDGDDGFALREAERVERRRRLTDLYKTYREQTQEWRRSSRIYAVPPVPPAEEKDLALEPLSEEAEAAVTAALQKGRRHEILAVHQTENIEITRELMSSLADLEWLNDEVINVYLALLKERELAAPGKFLKCHFFNTFFFNKLYNDKKEYCYNNVRRWTATKKLKYLLHECDKIIVPIHLQMHWVLGVINIRERRFEFFDSLGPNYSKGIVDIIFSSLAQYIQDEAQNKADIVMDVSDWERVNHDDTPRQNNGSDCGMFMLKFADYHSRGQDFKFGPKDITYFRRRTVWEILQLKAT